MLPILTAREAFDRVLKYGHGRLVEPLEAYDQAKLMGGVIRLTSGTDLPPLEHISCKGRGNFLILGRGAKPPLRLRYSGSGNVLFLGAWSDLSGATIDISATDGIIFVGAFTRLSPTATLNLRGEDSALVIGNDCWIGERVIASNSDGHAIYSQETRQRINLERDILIGDRVFVGHDSRIAKGSMIEPDGIVLHGSLVSGQVRSHCAYSGVPARLVQEGVVWAPGTAGTLDEAEAAQAQVKVERLDALRASIAGFTA